MSSLLDARDIGDVCESERDRVDALVKQFEERFGATPDFLVRFARILMNLQISLDEYK